MYQIKSEIILLSQWNLHLIKRLDTNRKETKKKKNRVEKERKKSWVVTSNGECKISFNYTQISQVLRARWHEGAQKR